MILPLIAQIHAAGLFEPELEARVCPERKWRWDFCWPEVRIAVEIQGGTWGVRDKRTGRRIPGGHNRGKQYESDAEKLAEGQLQGYIVLFVTSDMIADGRALTLIQRAFEMRNKEEEAL